VTCPRARKPGTVQIILTLSEIRGDGGLKLNAPLNVGAVRAFTVQTIRPVCDGFC